MQSSYSDGFFDISPAHGFLPARPILLKGPDQFAVLQEVCENLPIIKSDKRFGTMHSFGAIEKEVARIPNYIELLKSTEFSVDVYQFLYRHYCMLVSSYCLEPTYRSYCDNRTYAKARNVLPENIAVPFCFVAEKIGVFPWLDYHFSYGPGNFVIVNKKPMEDYQLDDISICSLFCGDLDEINFIKVHILINLASPRMIEGILSTLTALTEKNGEKVADSLRMVSETVQLMNEKRRLMWGSSEMKRYAEYRIFLMGITGNEKIFDDGVLYTGVSEDRIKYRGETGAQDDIIPTLDIFTGVTDFYPDTILTKYLEDLRQYRPKVVIKFFRDLERECKGVFDRVSEVGGVKALVHLASIVNEIYNFRNGHWQFVQKYIMRNTTYNVATGGTPLNLWLPNQIKACLEKMDQLLNQIKNESQQIELLDEHSHKIYQTLAKDHPVKTKLLSDQMEMLRAHFQIEQVIKLDDTQS